MTTPREQQFAEHAKVRFERSCTTLDDATRQALRNRRRAVLATVHSGGKGWQRFIPAGAVATVMAIAATLWLGPPPATRWQSENGAISAQAALATAEESAQTLDDDPDFYLWLASEPIADVGFDAVPQFDEESTL